MVSELHTEFEDIQFYFSSTDAIILSTGSQILGILKNDYLELCMQTMTIMMSRKGNTQNNTTLLQTNYCLAQAIYNIHTPGVMTTIRPTHGKNCTCFRERMITADA